MEKIKEIFSADLRSLAILRIGTGILVLIDLLLRFGSFIEHYTDLGFFPKENIVGSLRPGAWSIHLFSGEPLFQATLFIIAAIFAICLMVGYKTKIATIVSFILIVSLQNSNAVVLNGGDTILKLLLFWGIFMPWGCLFSYDSRGVGLVGSFKYLGWGPACYYFQIFIIYLFAFMLKTGPEWNANYSAVYYAISADQWVSPFAQLLLIYPLLLVPITFFVRWLELIGPIFLFSPFWTARIRLVIISLLVFMHLSFFVFFSIGIFPLISAVSVLGFLPSLFWEKIGINKNSHESLSTRQANKQEPFNVFALFFIVFIVLWNLQSLGLEMSTNFIKTGFFFGIHQRWNLFAPSPPYADQWFVIKGKTENGTEFNLLSKEKPVSFGKPGLISSEYRDNRWREMISRVLLLPYPLYRNSYIQYLCKETYRGEKADSIQIFLLTQKTPEPSRPADNVQINSFVEKKCM